MNLTEWAHYSFSFLLSQSVAFYYLLLETLNTNRLKIDLEKLILWSVAQLRSHLLNRGDA